MDFVFDCPQVFIDINAALQIGEGGQIHNDAWFSTYHPEHNEILVPETSAAVSIPKGSLPNKTGVNNKRKEVSGNDVRKVTKSSKNSFSDNDLTKEIRLFNQKRFEMNRPASKPIDTTKKENISGNSDDTLSGRMRTTTKRAEIVAKATTKTSQRVPLVKDTRIDDIEREIQAFNNRLSENKLVASTRSFALAVPVVKKHDAKKPDPKKPAALEKKLSSSTDDILKILKQHNEQFGKKAVYEPARHSVRDVRAWEKQSGKIWATLSTEDRESANQEILRMKALE